MRAGTAARRTDPRRSARPALWLPPRPRPGTVVRRTPGGLRRVGDACVAAFLLLLVSPLFLIIALATRLESGGPVMFRQRRALGFEDPPFDVFKFRSMVHAADEARASLEDLNEADGALFKIRNDPRLTRVGRFLRRHSLDELPQLLNVIRGDMRLVGPRPLPVADLDRVRAAAPADARVRLRARARPGMTGLWQISGRSALGFEDMLALDLYYLEHHSLLLDLEILIRTVPVVLFGRGAW